MQTRKNQNQQGVYMYLLTRDKSQLNLFVYLNSN